MPRPRNFWKHLKREKEKYFVGSSGAASDVRIIDPLSGRVVAVVPARKRILPRTLHQVT
jgi:hypothetical protein